MILDFTKLSDKQVRFYLKFLKEDIFEKGSIERYIISGKCTKIKVTYYDTIMIEPERILFIPENGKPRIILTIENLKGCINIYNALTEN
jgi:hypothetical protein